MMTILNATYPLILITTAITFSYHNSYNFQNSDKKSHLIKLICRSVNTNYKTCKPEFSDHTIQTAWKALVQH